MSWTTGTQTECLGANNAVGASNASFTSAVSISPITGAAYLPANFFLPSYGIGKSLLVKASGTLNTTAAPTVAWGITANTTLGTTTAATTLAAQAGTLATTTLVASQTDTNQYWELECLITCTATGGTATGAVLAYGVVKSYYTSTNVQTWRLSSSAANPNTSQTFGTGGTTAAWYIELAAAFGTSSSSNTIQCYSYIVMGLN